MAERFDHRLDSWMTQADVEFIERLAAAEATSTSGAIRKLIRLARIHSGQYQQQPQPAE